MSKTDLFFVTYKKLSKKVLPSEYEKCIEVLSKRGTIIDKRYETDSKGKLHLHVVYECRKNPFIKQFIIKDFNVKFVPIYDHKQLQKYIGKQCKNDIENDQLCDAVYARQFYLFDDIEEVKINI